MQALENAINDAAENCGGIHMLGFLRLALSAVGGEGDARTISPIPIIIT
jgi:hypothetical protein